MQPRQAELELQRKREELARLQAEAAEAERRRKAEEERLRQQAEEEARRRRQEEELEAARQQADFGNMETFVDDMDGGVMGFGDDDEPAADAAPADDDEVPSPSRLPPGAVRVLPQARSQAPDTEGGSDAEDPQPADEVEEPDAPDEQPSSSAYHAPQPAAESEDESEDEDERKPQARSPSPQELTLEQRAAQFGGLKQHGTGASIRPGFARRPSADPQPESPGSAPATSSARTSSKPEPQLDHFEEAQRRRKKAEKEATKRQSAVEEARAERERLFQAKQDARRAEEMREQQRDFERLRQDEQNIRQKLRASQGQRSEHGLTPVQLTLAKERWAFEDREAEAGIVLQRSALERKWMQRNQQREQREKAERAEFDRHEADLRSREESELKATRKASSSKIFDTLNKFQSAA